MHEQTETRQDDANPALVHHEGAVLDGPSGPNASRLDDASPPDGGGIGTGRGRSWLFVIGAALLAALILRLLVFEAYRIPSTSMADTLLIGDFVFVSKLHYGPRLPLTLGVPFTDRFLRQPEMPPIRLPGLQPVRRGEVIVFNYPPAPQPIDRRIHYIKRVYGLPGDTVRIVGKQPILGRRTASWPRTARHYWRVTVEPNSMGGALGALNDMGYAGRFDRISEQDRLFEGTSQQADTLRGHAAVRRVVPYIRGDHEGQATFPSTGPFTLDDFGPLVVPEASLTVPLNDSTWALYRDVITRFEGRRAARVAGGFEVDGALVDDYTFRDDYYFVLGDNRDDSADSRSWGFVPSTHVVGKAVLVYFSWDPNQQAPRWSRFFRRIETEF